MKPNPLPFIRERWLGVQPPTASFAGKTIIVTGSNTGIGFEAACKYAELNAAQVILAVRDIQKGMKALQQIAARTKAKLWSIQKFAARATQLKHLDIAVLNAGITPNDYVVSSEGWESILQVNVLSTALLGLLLLPKLRETEGSHLLLVTSEAHRWLEASDFPAEGNVLQAANIKSENWNPLLQNAKSKLFAMYIVQELAALADGRVIVTGVCPGACKSDLMRDLWGRTIGQTITLSIFDFIFNKPTEQGGWSYVWATTLGNEAHGKWYKTTRLTEPGKLVTSELGKQMQNQVWTEIMKSLIKSVPDIEGLGPEMTPQSH